MVLDCIYTVRDMGFVDIGSILYCLYYYIQEETPAELASIFKQIAYASLIDSNVEVKIIDVDKQKDQQDQQLPTVYDLAMKYLAFWEVQSFPAAILGHQQLSF